MKLIEGGSTKNQNRHPCRICSCGSDLIAWTMHSVIEENLINNHKGALLSYKAESMECDECGNSFRTEEQQIDCELSRDFAILNNEFKFGEESCKLSLVKS